MSETVKVIVRARPFNKREKDKRCARCVTVDTDAFAITLKRPSGPPKTFTFDGVYDEDSKQKDVYMEAAAPLVDSVLEGYNATIFAYGQTGCGKTFTMEGVPSSEELQGIIPQSFRHVFGQIGAEDCKERQYLVRAAYIEIYNEEVRDLLGPDPQRSLPLKEDKERGVFVHGMTQTVVKDVDATLELMARGNGNRTTGFTLMNADSSRSHSIFMLSVETSEPNEAGEQAFRAGKLNLVDLAGSERQSKTQASGDRLKEATKINLSLSALGNVISALVAGKGKHIPYRDSKLTRLLQDSLGGNTKTTMVAAISPADDNYDETLSTLRYANRAKNIKNKPKINEDPKDTLLREYQEEIDRLRKIVAAGGAGDGGAGGDGGGAGGGGSADTAAAGPAASGGGSAANAEAAAEARAARAEALETEAKLKEQLDAEQRRLLEHRLESERERARLAEEKSRAEEETGRERAEREALQAKLAALEGQLVASQGQEESDKAKAEQKLRQTALRLKKEKREKARLEEERALAEERRLALEESYGALEQAGKGTAERMRHLAQRCEAAEQEARDLEAEFEEERSGYQRTVREMAVELAFQRALVERYMSRAEVNEARRGGRWDADRGVWQLDGVGGSGGGGGGGGGRGGRRTSGRGLASSPRMRMASPQPSPPPPRPSPAPARLGALGRTVELPATEVEGGGGGGVSEQEPLLPSPPPRSPFRPARASMGGTGGSTGGSAGGGGGDESEIANTLANLPTPARPRFEPAGKLSLGTDGVGGEGEGGGGSGGGSESGLSPAVLDFEIKRPRFEPASSF